MQKGTLDNENQEHNGPLGKGRHQHMYGGVAVNDDGELGWVLC